MMNKKILPENIFLEKTKKENQDNAIEKNLLFSNKIKTAQLISILHFPTNASPCILSVDEFKEKLDKIIECCKGNL